MDGAKEIRHTQEKASVGRQVLALLSFLKPFFRVTVEKYTKFLQRIIQVWSFFKSTAIIVSMAKETIGIRPVDSISSYYGGELNFPWPTENLSFAPRMRMLNWLPSPFNLSHFLPLHSRNLEILRVDDYASLFLFLITLQAIRADPVEDSSPIFYKQQMRDNIGLQQVSIDCRKKLRDCNCYAWWLANFPALWTIEIFAWNSDWFIALFAPVAIGWSYYFGIGFTAATW